MATTYEVDLISSVFLVRGVGEVLRSELKIKPTKAGEYVGFSGGDY